MISARGTTFIVTFIVLQAITQGQCLRHLGNVRNKNIALLTASLTQVVGDQYKSAAILKRMHEHTIKKDREKKEKSKDWHEVTKKVILHAASVDGHTPETNIPTTLRAIVNARSIGAAEAPNTKLSNQMRIMGHEEVGWHISFTHNLRNGQVLYMSRLESHSISLSFCSG